MQEKPKVRVYKKEEKKKEYISSTLVSIIIIAYAFMDTFMDAYI